MIQWFSSTDELQENNPKAVDVTFLSQLSGGVVSAHNMNFDHLSYQEKITILSCFIFFFWKTYSGSRYPAVPLTTVVT